MKTKVVIPTSRPSHQQIVQIQTMQREVQHRQWEGSYRALLRSVSRRARWAIFLRRLPQNRCRACHLNLLHSALVNQHQLAGSRSARLRRLGHPSTLVPKLRLRIRARSLLLQCPRLVQDRFLAEHQHSREVLVPWRQGHQLLLDSGRWPNKNKSKRRRKSLQTSASLKHQQKKAKNSRRQIISTKKQDHNQFLDRVEKYQPSVLEAQFHRSGLRVMDLLRLGRPIVLLEQHP